MIKTIDDFYLGATEYIRQFNDFAEKHGLKSCTKADHICYKCESKEVFESMRVLFEDNSYFVYQSIIANRRIAVIKLKKSIETLLGSISILELSDQKLDNSQSSKYDHIEIYPTIISYDELVKKIQQEGEKIIKVERPHHTTHDIDIGSSFLIRLTQGPLLEKIKSEEMATSNS